MLSSASSQQICQSSPNRFCVSDHQFFDWTDHALMHLPSDIIAFLSPFVFSDTRARPIRVFVSWIPFEVLYLSLAHTHTQIAGVKRPTHYRQAVRIAIQPLQCHCSAIAIATRDESSDILMNDIWNEPPSRVLLNSTGHEVRSAIFNHVQRGSVDWWAGNNRQQSIRHSEFDTEQ